MPKNYLPLSVIHLNTGSTFTHPPTAPEVVYLEDPALHVMNDLALSNAITISPDATIREAAMEMRVCHTHLLLVINHENNVIGLISSEDILGEKPLMVTVQRRIQRAEITVRMVMTPQEKIATFTLKDIQHAKVGNVVASLHQLKQHYGLIVEVDEINHKQTVRGLFSLSKISKQLGYDVLSDISEAQSLAELQKNLGKDQ